MRIDGDCESSRRFSYQFVGVLAFGYFTAFCPDFSKMSS